MGIVLIVGKAAWDSYAERVKTVKLPKHAIKFNVELAAAAWQDELVQCIRHSLFDRTNLSLMGVRLSPASPEEPFEGVAPFVLDFVLCLLDARTQSGIQHSESYPAKFARALAASPDMTPFKLDWEILLKAEALARRSDCLREAVDMIRFNEAVAPRLVFMLMERSGWSQDDPDTQYLLNGLFNRIGDTLIIENIHKDLRRLGKHSQNEIISHTKRMFHTARARALQSRRIPMVSIPNEEVVDRFTSNTNSDCQLLARMLVQWVSRPPGSRRPRYDSASV